MRILFVLSGFHRINRGAEISFISIARELAKTGNDVTLIGSGQPREGEPYRFLHAPSISRNHFATLPSAPALRADSAYEDLTFVPGLLWRYRPAQYDVTLTSDFPWPNWALRRPSWRGLRPSHVFVTQNGDWAPHARNREHRFFGCDGLVCTNPDFYQRNASRWRSALIPNGVDTERFRPGPAVRDEFGLPADKAIVLMVSALISSKRVEMGIAAVSKIPDAHLVVAGDGPLRKAIEDQAAALLPGRFTRLSVSPDRMPSLYRSADVFLHLSKDEAFGNVFIEALACGRPVVAPDITRYRWIVGNDEFLVDSEDADTVAGGIRQALSDAPRPEQRAAKVQAFSWTNIASKYQKFLTEVIASRCDNTAAN